MRNSIRNVSHPAEQEMMKLPARVCGECVMWTGTQLIVGDYYLNCVLMFMLPTSTLA